MGKIKGFLKNYFLVEYFKAFFFPDLKFEKTFMQHQPYLVLKPHQHLDSLTHGQGPPSQEETAYEPIHGT